jgi:hypothetical protein
MSTSNNNNNNVSLSATADRENPRPETETSNKGSLALMVSSSLDLLEMLQWDSLVGTFFLVPPAFVRVAETAPGLHLTTDV